MVARVWSSIRRWHVAIALCLAVILLIAVGLIFAITRGDSMAPIVLANGKGQLVPVEVLDPGTSISGWGSLTFAPDSSDIILTAYRYSKTGEIHIVDITTPTVSRVVSTPKGVIDLPITTERDGERGILYPHIEKSGVMVHVEVVSLLSGETVRNWYGVKNDMLVDVCSIYGNGTMMVSSGMRYTSSVSVSSQVRLWNLTSGDHEVLARHERGRHCHPAVHESKELIAMGWDDDGVGYIQMYDLRRHEILWTSKTSRGHAPESLAFSTGGDTLYCGTIRGDLEWRDTGTGRATKIVPVYQGDYGSIECISVAQDDTLLAIGGGSAQPGAHWGELTILDAQSGAFLATPLVELEWPVTFVSFSPDGKWLAAVPMFDPKLWFWKVASP